MKIMLDPKVAPLVDSATKEAELIQKISPTRGKLSAALLVNTIVFEYLTNWNKRKK